MNIENSCYLHGNFTIFNIFVKYFEFPSIKVFGELKEIGSYNFFLTKHVIGRNNMLDYCIKESKNIAVCQ